MGLMPLVFTNQFGVHMVDSLRSSGKHPAAAAATMVGWFQHTTIGNTWGLAQGKGSVHAAVWHVCVYKRDGFVLCGDPTLYQHRQSCSSSGVSHCAMSIGSLAYHTAVTAVGLRAAAVVAPTAAPIAAVDRIDSRQQHSKLACNFVLLLTHMCSHSPSASSSDLAAAGGVVVIACLMASVCC